MQANLISVDFHGTALQVATIEGTHYVAVRPICDALGVDWSAQYRRIQRTPILNEAVAVMATPSSGGEQQTLLLALDKLNGWLFGISTARIKDPERRERLLQYQRECFDVLAAHFGATRPASLPYKEQRGQSLTEEQCAELRAMLTGGAAQVPEDMRGQFMVQGWSRLKAHFGCTYRHIPAARFEEARDIIARHIAAFLPQPALGLDPFDAQAMNAARKAAIDWFCGKQATPDNIPHEVLQGLVAQALMSRRFLLDFSLWRGRWEAGIITLDPHDCIINYDTTSADTIAENTPRHRIPELITALAKRAAKMLSAPAAQ